MTAPGQTAPMPAAVDTVLFDLGNVLVDWNPRHLYSKIFAGRPREMDWFLTHVCNKEWNARHDGGESFPDNVATLAAAHPWYAREIDAYWSRWSETMKGEIAGSVALLRRLHARGTAVHALTNWSADTFPFAEQAFDWLELFGHIVVSGRIGLVKPNADIFEHAAEMCPLQPESTLFVDDSEVNTRAAEALGFHVHHFTKPEGLEQDLIARSLL